MLQLQCLFFSAFELICQTVHTKISHSLITVYIDYNFVDTFKPYWGDKGFLSLSEVCGVVFLGF